MHTFRTKASKASLLRSAISTLGPDMASSSITGDDPHAVKPARPTTLMTPLVGVHQRGLRWLMLSMLDEAPLDRHARRARSAADRRYRQG